MPTPIVFEDVAPVVPVRDLQAALERYRQLGFEVRAYGHGTGYGYAQRGAVSIHLSELPAPGIVAVWNVVDLVAHRLHSELPPIVSRPCIAALR